MQSKQSSLTKVDFVVCFEISLLVESSPTDGAAVGFLSCMDQLVPLQLVGMREFFATYRAVILDLLFGLLQELGRDVYRDTHHFSTRALLPFVVKESEITQLYYKASNITKQIFLISNHMPTRFYVNNYNFFVAINFVNSFIFIKM